MRSYILSNGQYRYTIQVNENEKVNKQQSYVSNEIYGKEKELDDENKSNEDNELEKSENINEPFMEAFKSWRFHLFNFMSVGTLCKNILKIFNKKF